MKAMGALPLPLALNQTHCRSLQQTGMDKMVKDLQQTLETYQQELEGSQQGKAALEKECVIYQSQLQVSTWWPRALLEAWLTPLKCMLLSKDLQRQLDMERHGRRNSESRALQLLSEIRDKSQKAQELRDSKSK